MAKANPFEKSKKDKADDKKSGASEKSRSDKKADAKGGKKPMKKGC